MSYELYLVCKSNILLKQGDDPTKPLNKNEDFYVGDIFQAKKSNEYNNKYIQLRAASKGNKKQWINIENDMIKNIFPPQINEYNHLKIGSKSTTKCKYLNKFLTKIIDEIYGLFIGIDSISNIIITYLPFSYPIFTCNATLFRGRGHFTQFSVPYFHSKSHCKEYLRRIEELRNDTIQILLNNNDKQIDETIKKERDILYEKKLMLKYNENMNFEKENDPQFIKKYENMNEDEKDEENENKINDKLLNEEILNEIVSVQKGSLPLWIEEIYKSISSKNSYYYCAELYFIKNDNMIPFKIDEYLEQNKYPNFIISNFKWNNAILKAIKIGQTLQDIININKAGGSRWFDVEFDSNNNQYTKIYDKSVKIFRCKIGGKWQGDDRSRHYIDCKDENGQIFDKYLPMIVINIVI